MICTAAVTACLLSLLLFIDIRRDCRRTVPPPTPKLRNSHFFPAPSSRSTPTYSILDQDIENQTVPLALQIPKGRICQPRDCPGLIESHLMPYIPKPRPIRAVDDDLNSCSPIFLNSNEPRSFGKPWAEPQLIQNKSQPKGFRQKGKRVARGWSTSNTNVAASISFQGFPSQQCHQPDTMASSSFGAAATSSQSPNTSPFPSTPRSSTAETASSK